MKTTSDPHFDYLGVFNLFFFWHNETFFENFLIVPKGPPFNFFYILGHNRCLKIPKGPPSRLFGTMRLFKIVIFRLILGFLNTYPPIYFFNTIRNSDVIYGVMCYIRIFDVISEVFSVSLRRRPRFENKCSHLSQLLYHSTEGLLWVNLFCEFFIKKRHEHILKILHFLSLRYSGDFGRSRLVLSFLCH